MSKKKLAVFVSGSGSNLQAIIDASKEDDFPAIIDVVISNKENAYALDRAKNNNIETKVIKNTDYKNREEFDLAIIDFLKDRSIDLICLAGFMRLITKKLIDSYKIINIHPSLLPSFKGINAPAQAINYGVKIAGCTTHYVTEEMDAGPIIMQEYVRVSDEDNAESLASKILEKEHILYPKTIRKIFQ